MNVVVRLSYCMFYFALIKGRSKMTQYNTLNVKFSNWKFNKLKSRTKNGTEVTLNIFSYVFGDSDDENSFLRKLKFLQIIIQLIQNYQKLNYIK